MDLDLMNNDNQHFVSLLPLRVNEARKKAMEYFAQNGFPKIGSDGWKYTNLAPLSSIPFAPDGVQSPMGDRELAPLTFEDTHRWVMVNGRISTLLSSANQDMEGVEISQLSPDCPDLGGVTDYGFQKLAPLNAALWTDGLFLRVKKGVKVAKPLHFLFLSSTSGKPVCSFPRMLIVLEEASEATFIESYEGFSLDPFLSVPVTEIITETGAHLTHYKIQEEGLKTYHLGSASCLQRSDSFYSSTLISLGGLLSRTEIHVLMEGRGAECQLNGLTLANGTQHMDSQTLIDHRATDQSSREIYKGILDGKSRGIFGGKIVVHKGAHKTKARQINKNLLLSETAEADPTPQLEIHDDDVAVNHGSTVGQLDHEQIYYLRSRGIDEPSAKSLLTYAFARDIIDGIDFMPIRKRLNDALLSHLPASQIVKEVT